jgi:hypothetical protein
MADVTGDAVVLQAGRMQALVVGPSISLWAFVSADPLATVLQPEYLGNHTVLQPGDQVAFKCGPPGAVVSGTLAVLEVREAAGSEPARVHLALLSSTLAATRARADALRPAAA